MRLTVCILCLSCLVGCSSMRQVTDGSVPKLLFQSTLPPIPETIQHPIFDLDIVLFVTEDGSVGKTRMLKGSGNAVWDSLALASMKQWRFAPARVENQPIGAWFHMQTTLRYADPQYMKLAEILCTSDEEADSVYKAIQQGQNFNELAMRYSVDPSREMSGMLGEVNINLYPEYIRRPLSKLDKNEYTDPIKYGDLFVILKDSINKSM
jgi:TonB family protein